MRVQKLMTLRTQVQRRPIVPKSSKSHSLMDMRRDGTFSIAAATSCTRLCQKSGRMCCRSQRNRHRTVSAINAHEMFQQIVRSLNSQCRFRITLHAFGQLVRQKKYVVVMRLKRGLDCVPFAFPSTTRSSGNQRGHVPGHGEGKATSRCAALAAKAGDGFITGNRRNAKNQKRVRMRGIFHCEPHGVKRTSRLARASRAQRLQVG